MGQILITGTTEKEAIFSFLSQATSITNKEFSIEKLLNSFCDYFGATNAFVVEKNAVSKNITSPTTPHIKAPFTLEGEVTGFLIIENPSRNQDHTILLSVMAGSVYKEIIHAKKSKLIHDLRRTRINLEYINKTVEDSGIGIWGIFNFDKEEPQMVANPKMLELLGITDSQMDNKEIYRHWYSRIVPEYESTVQDSVKEMINGIHSENTYMWNHPTKGRIYVRCGGTLSTAASGTKFLSGYHSDVTAITLKEQETQKKLEFATLEAKKATEAKAEFLSRMSHDIRTPLNGIIGILDIDERHPDDRALIDSNRAKARAAANHLLSLVNDVLNLNKLESGNVSLAHEAFCLPDLANDVLTIIGMRASEEGLTFNHPDCSVQMKFPYVFGSPLHIKQVLLNVMSNAIKYNKAGGSINCKTSFVSSNDKQVFYKVVISDTGIGMSEEFQKHLFEPFAQERIDARSTYQGTGLGMTIAKNLVEKMNGTIEVQSKIGVGTTFTITVPFDIASKNDLPQKKVINSSILQGKKVLLVEDNELNIEIAQAILKDMDITVTHSTNGKEAVEIFASTPAGTFDIILMDIMMPIMNGYDATIAIRKLNHKDAKKIPIVAMTANAFDEDRQRGITSGMNAYLSKPIIIDDLKKTLAEVLFC